MLSRARGIIAAALCMCLVTSALVNVPIVSAAAFTNITSKPAPISSDTTPSFGFMAMAGMGGYSGDFECQIDGSAPALCTSPYITSSLGAGDHTFTVSAVDDPGPSSTATYDWNINLPPTFSGGSSVSGVAGIPVSVTDLQIDDVDNDIFGVTLTVPSGVLKLSTITGITFSGSSTGSSIAFSGTRTNLNTALATLVYTPSTNGTFAIDATLKGGSGSTRDSFNGHFYRLVTPAANWSTAKAAAEASTYGGVSGYLANINSAEEEDYLQERIADGVWTGGSDSAVEGTWRWTGGPENGTAFSSGASAVNGSYVNWQALQPDNYNGTENCLEMRVDSGASWNDENCNSSRQYLIEYGADGSLPSLDTAQLSATIVSASGDADGDGLTNSVEANGPNSGDANNDGTADYTQANVSSQYSALSHGYTVIQTSCTVNQQVQLHAESVSQNDPTYDYPYGLASFTANGCGTAGGTIQVNQFYFGATDSATLTARKWNSTKNTYSTIDSAVVSDVTIAGKQAVKVAYQVVDGGVLDQDGVANSSIVDPAGLARVVVAAPNTGLEPQQGQLLLFLLLGFIALLGAYRLADRR